MSAPAPPEVKVTATPRAAGGPPLPAAGSGSRVPEWAKLLLSAIAAVAALLSVLVPVINTQGTHLRREMDTLRVEVVTLQTDLTGEVVMIVRGDLTALRGDVANVRTDRHGLGERVARH